MSRHRSLVRFLTGCIAAFLATGAHAAPDKRSAAVERLRASAGPAARISINPATGAARFVSVPQGSLSPAAAGSAEEKAAAFFGSLGDAFGVTDARQLVLKARTTDPVGMTHLDYRQVYSGVPVFGGVVKAHFDQAGALRSVNGVFVPDLNLSVVPRLTAAEAGQIALEQVASRKQPQVAPTVRHAALTIFRTGLVKGVPGTSHLAYEVEVFNAKDVREFVYVDAQAGKVLDYWSGVNEALSRRVYDGGYGPSFVVWNEGDPFPTPDVDINNIITFTKDTYDLYMNAFGRDSYSGTGTLMEIVNDDPTINCPNANWNSVSTNYCTGVTGDDTVAHEWTHAYTEYTHGLIYAWQQGALNESYSDIFGEVVDTINGPNTPDVTRSAGGCSTHGGVTPPTLTITGGPAAGTYAALASVNEPPLPFTVGPTDMAIASPPGACTAVTGVSGRIAIIDWTLLPGGGNECGSAVRAQNALNAGATGIIFVAPEAGFLNLGSLATIGSVQVSYADGATIKAGLPAQATMTFEVGADDSFRWLSGEDDAAFGGAIRDMWNPTCFGDPDRVAPARYVCGPFDNDNGGVHTNSGIPNHAFALMVDGGTFNGQTVTGIGWTRAAHIYFRAMSQYQNLLTDFPDHADALEQSCTDLVGTSVTDLFGGPAVPVDATHCTQVAAALTAVGMRTEPAFCNFQPQFDPVAPPACASGTQQAIFTETFESNPVPAWTLTHQGVTGTFTPRDWTWTSTLPDRPGSGLFGPDPDIGTCSPSGDESGVLFATSPAFTIPAGAAARLSFDHWVGTEQGWDGGNVKVSVNGGPFTPINPADFTFNPYGQTLEPAPGNTNPLAGEPGFTGTDGGTPGGSWARSYVNLAPYAQGGDSVRLRLEMGTDGCTGFVGWYMDDVTVYHCAGAASLSAFDASVIEGNAGTAAVGIEVRLSASEAAPVTVDYQTADGSATTGNNDYTAATGTLTFTPGQTSHTVTLSVVGDTNVEPNETFFLNLANATGASIADGQGTATIINDDGGTGITDTRSELSHGYKTVRSLDNATHSNSFWIQTQAASSYEVVVDGASGDVGTGNGPLVERLASDGSTVLASAEPVGTGPARSLRWQTSSSGALNLVRVQSASCTTDCDANDTYRLRAYETTYSIPRFNNTGSQVTVLLLQNPTAATVQATAYFYDTAGTLLTSEPYTLDPKSVRAVILSTIGPIATSSGSVVIAHDAPFGALAGKTVAVEPATGFSFDSPMLTRTR